MIIEKFDEAQRAQQDKLKRKIKRIAADANEDAEHCDCVDLEVYVDAEAQIDGRCNEYEQIQPRRLYVSGHQVNDYRKYKLAGQPCDATKPRGTTKPLEHALWATVGAFSSPILVAAFFIPGAEVVYGIMGILGIILSIIYWIGEIPATRMKYQNFRVNHARVDKIKQYELEGSVAAMLADNLTNDEYNRMIDWLGQDISAELHRIFTSYYSKIEFTLETIDEFNVSTMNPEVRDTYLLSLNDKANSLADEAAGAIRGVFAAHDKKVEATEIEVQEEAKAAEIARQEAAAMDTQFAHETLIQKANYVLSQ